MKPQIIHVEYSLNALRQFHINTRVVDKNARIDEIRLALNLAAAQTGQQTVWLDQPDSGLRQPYAVAIPKRELSARKIRIVKDCIKARSLVVCGIFVSLRPQERPFESQVIYINRTIHRSHMLLDLTV